MGYSILVHSLLSVSFTANALRLKASDLVKNESRGIEDLAMQEIDAKEFPAVAGFMQNVKSGRDESTFKAIGDEEDLQVRALILASLSRCWQPSPHNQAAYTDPAVLEEMLQAMRKETSNLHGDMSQNQYQRRPVHVRSPIGAFGPLKSVASHHHAISFVHEQGKGVEGHCLHFDYTKNGGADPAGCRFFQKAFKPIQRLTQCVRKEVRLDPYFKVRQLLHSKQNASVAEIHDPRTMLPRQLDSALIEREKKLWDHCRKGMRKRCEQMDEFKRTMEMLKRVEFKEWSGMSPDQIYEALKHTITQTRSIPEGSSLPSLSDGTVNTIVEKCFELESPTLDANSDAGPVVFYKEALKCLPLVWDAVEVPRAPYQLIWFNEGWKEVVTDFQGVHPLCGRFALAPLAIEWRESHTKYAETTWNTIGDSIQDTFDAYECFKREHATCRTLAECWKFIMMTHMADLSEHCAPPRFESESGEFDVTDFSTLGNRHYF